MIKNDAIDPVFYYALTDEVVRNCPCELDGKTIQAEQFLPSRSRNSDVAYDVRCAETTLIKLSDGTEVRGIELFPGCYFKMSLGFRAFIPEDWWLNIAPRSSAFIKDNIQALYGIIDRGYENIFCFVGQFQPNACDMIDGGKRWIIPFGKRVAQLVVVPLYSQEVKGISNEKLNAMYLERNDPRGVGGFGSSGSA